MALKFLNKKGWHTGSLRNIENVWKAEQKHDAEQKKLEELRKQIHEERERSEFRHLQEQAGLVPRQERLDFLYESGLAVGKGSEGFKALEAPATAAAAASSASADAGSSKAAVPGALFEDKEKPQAANDAWRKLHSDPLLQIRQREQEALARVKNNPVQMAMIRKSVEAKKSKKDDKEKREKKKHKRKHHHKTKSVRNSDSEDTSGSEEDRRKRSRVTSSPQERSKRKHSSKATDKDVEERRNRPTSDRHEDKSSKHGIRSDSRYSSESEEDRRKSSHSRNSSRLPNRDEDKSSKHGKHPMGVRSDSRYSSESEEDRRKSSHSRNSSRLTNRDEDRSSKHVKHPAGVRSDSRYSSESEEDRRKSSHSRNSSRLPPRLPNRDESRLPNIEEERRKHGDEDHKNKETRARDQQGPAYSRRKGVPKMTEEEREARLREMQMDAEMHEEQRWKRINKAAEADALEAARASSSRGKNFLDEAQKSIYGAEKGGSSTIEESVRRRAYYSQGGTAAHESNAFRR